MTTVLRVSEWILTGSASVGDEPRAFPSICQTNLIVGQPVQVRKKEVGGSRRFGY